MSEEYDDLERLAPQKLLETFSRGKVFMCVVTALVLHIVIIGGLSSSFIYYEWINPEAGKQLEEAEQKAAAAGVKAPKKPPASAGTNKVAAAGPKTVGKGGDTQAKLLEQHKDAPVVKEITKKAKPADIPTEPEGLGISIDETNQ